MTNPNKSQVLIRKEELEMIGLTMKDRAFKVLLSSNYRQFPVTKEAVDALNRGVEVHEVFPQESTITITNEVFEEIQNTLFTIHDRRKFVTFEDVDGKKFLIVHGNEKGQVEIRQDQWQKAFGTLMNTTLISCYMGLVNADDCLFYANTPVHHEIVSKCSNTVTLRFFSEIAKD